MTLESRLQHIESLLLQVLQREQAKSWYGIEEFARFVGRSRFTCREWCRLGRIEASKKASGRGAHAEWVISHDELLRFQREGLRQPCRKSRA